VGKDGRLINWGGNLSAYGIKSLKKGEPIWKQVFFLDGLLPLDDAPLFLECVKAGCGLSADIHIFPGDEGNWILFLDATLEETRRRLLQQKTNELSLLRRKLSKICNQCPGKNVAGKLPQESRRRRENAEM